MVYSQAVEGLDAEGRNELDAALEVAGWPAAGRTPQQAAERPAGVPGWWQGPEEASQSVLRGLGIDLAELDRRAGGEGR
jgi:hypothetical protein